MRQGGSDVITKTALKRINWSNYKIAQNTDKVGVFVSIVSTRIPYKGAGKEYIGGTFHLNCSTASCTSAHCYPRKLHMCCAHFPHLSCSKMLMMLQRMTWRSWCTL